MLSSSRRAFRRRRGRDQETTLGAVVGRHKAVWTSSGLVRDPKRHAFLHFGVRRGAASARDEKRREDDKVDGIHLFDTLYTLCVSMIHDERLNVDVQISRKTLTTQRSDGERVYQAAVRAIEYDGA